MDQSRKAVAQILALEIALGVFRQIALSAPCGSCIGRNIIERFGVGAFGAW